MRFKKIIIAVSAVLVAVAAIAASIKISDINEEKENYRSDAKQLQRFIENTKERGTSCFHGKFDIEFYYPCSMFSPFFRSSRFFHSADTPAEQLCKTAEAAKS